MRLPTLCGLGAILLWAFLALCAAALARLPPIQVATLGFAAASLLGLAIVAARGRLGALRQGPAAWALGVAGLGGYHALYFAALALAPPVEANLVNYLWPLFIVLLSAPLLGTRLAARHVLGAALGLAGCVVAVGGAARFDAAFLPGYALALAAALAWALYSVLSKRFAAVPSEAVAGFCAAAVPLLALLHLALETWITPTWSECLVLALLGAGPMGGAFLLWDIGMKHGEVRLIGTLAYATPVLSTLVLTVFGIAPFGWAILLAALLVAAGGLLAAR